MCDKNGPEAISCLVGGTLRAAVSAPGRRGASSQRKIPMLLGRIAVPLPPERSQRLDQSGPGITRVDDIVDVAPRGGSVGMGKFAGVLLNQSARGCALITRSADLLLEKDFDRPLRPHD